MPVTKTAVRIIQESLKTKRRYRGMIDGIAGPRTLAGISRELAARRNELRGDMESWSSKRQTVACLQLICKDHRCQPGTIDGLWGPQTDFAYDCLVYLREHDKLPPPWRDLPPGPNPRRWPDEKPESKLINYYGQPGDQSNLVRATSPYTLKLAWDKSKTLTSFMCHKKVKNSIERVLGHTLNYYGLEKIGELRLDLFGGCYNKRKKRGGTTWSTHSWGIALDFDPERNQLRWGRERAHFAKPEYDKWWAFWEDEGWISLGRTENYDWMHVQAARR